MSEEIRKMMTSTLGEDGVKFVEEGEERPEMSVSDSLMTLATIEDITGNVLYLLKLLDMDYDFGKRRRITPNMVDNTVGDTETLIVPGYASRNCAFSRFSGVLAEHGIHSRPVREFEDLRLRTPFSADEAAALVQKRIERSTASRVNLVCHSMGGPNSLIGCNRLSGKNRKKVGRIITLGSPWNGSPLAPVLGRLKGDDKALRDLSRGSEILEKELPRVEGDIRELVVSIGSEKDCIVPWQSSVLDGALANPVLQNGYAVTHADFLHKRHVAEIAAGIFKMAA